MSLANKCMDFCQALASQGTSFSFTLTTGSQFSFSLDTRGVKAVEEVKKKKLSPSDVRRNARRRQEFLRRKPVAVSASQTTISPTSPAAAPRTCKRCNLPCQGHPAPGYGMGRCKVDLGTTGQSVSSPSTPENLREPNGARSSLTSSPLLTSREESCTNCGGAFSPSHQCEDEDEDKGSLHLGVATEGKHCGVVCCCHCDHEPECKCWTVGPYCGFDSCEIQEHTQETGSCGKM